MPTATQRYRQITVSTPLGDDTLLFRSMTAREHLGQPFLYQLDLLTMDGRIRFEDLLGHHMTIGLELAEGGVRWFDGIVSRFALVGTSGRYIHHQAELRPWLWFLTRNADCRIFQERKVPDIIKEVFRGHGFTDFDDALTGSYATREYCVQYRETDFDFVSRLMEEEGMYYFFTHRQGKHTLILADADSAHDHPPGWTQVPYFPPDTHHRRKSEHIYGLHARKDVQTGVVAIDDYDFERPRAELAVKASIPRSHPLGNFEVFDYPGEYLRTSEGDHYVRARIEELHADYEQVRLETNVRALAVGHLFQLTDFPNEALNREYLLTGADYRIESDQYESTGTPEAAEVYRCTLTALDARQPFRPPRRTPKAVVRGPQTAVVVGKAGEEIWTDEYGRVKVQFHWDRYGKSDENSSCWVRVAQIWAGKNWGAIHIPRIGQEVIIDFLEGDPDRPIITGRVYNADNMPPYGLPADKTRSGIKSRSSKGGSGGNYNEVRFEDAKGKEQLLIHAEKDQDIEVENDETHWVGRDRGKSIDHDETSTIAHNRTEKVGNDETITIGNNRTEVVGAKETITIGSNRTRTVKANEAVTIVLTRTHNVGVNEAITIGAAQEINVGSARSLIVGASQSSKYGKDLTEKVGRNHDQIVDNDRSANIGENDTLQVGKQLTIEAGDRITIKTGKASITMKKDGSIAIQGKDISIKGSGGIDIKASKDVVIKGKKILQN